MSNKHEARQRLPAHHVERSKRPVPAAEQLAALRRWKERYGKGWRGRLLRAWETDQYPGEAVTDIATLRVLAQDYGPDWLRRVKL